MRLFQLRKKFLGALLMAFFALGMLTACSSTEETDPPPDTGGSSCAEQCASVPDMNQDECIIACEA